MEPFLGQIILFAGYYAIYTWAICDGSLLSVSQHSALFALLGTRYGGDGSSTFALPDLRGRMAIGAGTGQGLTPREIGQRGGAESVGLVVANTPSHTHTVNAARLSTTIGPGTSMLWGGSPDAGTQLFSNSAPNCQLSAAAIGNTGGLTSGNPHTAQLHDNMAPFMALTYLIALVGIYPDRE